MNAARFRFVLAITFVLLLLGQNGCERDLFSGSKLTLANYNLVTTGMSKGQVQQIMGAPKSMERKNMVLFEKTTWRYEEGKKFALLTFKNDELESKDSNLGTP